MYSRSANSTDVALDMPTGQRSSAQHSASSLSSAKPARFRAGLSFIDPTPTTQSYTRGALKRCSAVLRVVIIVFIPRIADLLRSLSPFFLFCPSTCWQWRYLRHAAIRFSPLRWFIHRAFRLSLIILAPSFPQLARTVPLVSVSDVLSSHFIQNTTQIFLRLIHLLVRPSSRYCSFRSFWVIALRNPTLYTYRPDAFPTNEYRPIGYS